MRLGGVLREEGGGDGDERSVMKEYIRAYRR